MPRDKAQRGTEKKSNGANIGFDGQIAHGDTFHNDRHPDLKADTILANPPFNVSDSGLPAPGNAVAPQANGELLKGEQQ